MCGYEFSDHETSLSYTGFITTRLVKGNSKGNAINKCREKLRLETISYDWVAGSIKSKAIEVLEVDEISALSYVYQFLPEIKFVNRLLGRYPTKGFSFYISK